MKTARFIVIIVLCIVPICLNALANWKTLSTDSFKIYYQPSMEDAAWHALAVLEHYRPYTEQLVGNTYPQAAIKLEDMGNLVNGWANPVGGNIALFLYPPTSDELSLSEDWFMVVGPHEYIHQLQLTKDGGVPRLLRKAFGNLFHVQLHQPAWMTEGITVYGESQLSPYAGRMNSGYYSALISSLAKERKLPSPEKAAYYSMDTPLAHYYVFGGSFHRYLAQTYSESHFAKLYEDNSSRPLAYLNGLSPSLALDIAFSNTYGKTTEMLWSDWQEYEYRKEFNTPKDRLTHDGFGKSSLKYHEGKLYYISNRRDKTSPGGGFSVNSIQSIDLSDPTKTPKDIILQNTEFPAGFDIVGDKLYYSRNQLRRGFLNKDNGGYGYYTELRQRNLSGSNDTILMSGNIRAFCALPNGDILYSEDDSNYRSAKLFRYSPSSGQKELLYSGEHLIHGILMYKDRLFLNAKGYWENSSIYTLESGKIVPLIDSPSGEILLNIVNDKLYYNVAVNDQLCAMEYDLKSGAQNQFTPVSYINSPVITPEGKVFFISINPDGQDVYSDKLGVTTVKAQRQKTQVAPFRMGEYKESGLINGKHFVREGNYWSNILHLANPRMIHIPQVYVDGDSLAIGAILAGNDAVGDFPSWQLSGLYDKQKDKLKVDFAIANNLFQPIQQEFQYSSDGGGEFVANQYVSIYQNANYSMNGMYIGMNFRMFDDYDRRTLNPYISNTFCFPGVRAQWYNGLFYEDQELLSSSVERLGWQSQLSLRKRTGKASEISSVLNLGLDPDADFDDVFYPIRGYDDELQANEGVTIRSTWHTSLAKIRRGNWSPHYYLEDVFGSVFYDVAIPFKNSSDNLQYSTGLELRCELSLLFMASISPGLRVGIDKGKNTFMGFILGMDY